MHLGKKKKKKNNLHSAGNCAHASAVPSLSLSCHVPLLVFNETVYTFKNIFKRFLMYHNFEFTLFLPYTMCGEPNFHVRCQLTVLFFSISITLVDITRTVVSPKEEVF